MKARLFLVSFGLAALSLVALGQAAQEQSQSKQDSDELRNSEQQLQRQFSDFQASLLRLQQKLSRGTPEERRRAEILGKILDECRNLAINQEFSKMVELLKNSRGTLEDLEKQKNQGAELSSKLSKLLGMLRDARFDPSKERKELEAYYKDLIKIINQQEDHRARTDLGKTDKGEHAKAQDKIADNTADLAKKIQDFLDKQKGDKGKGGETGPPSKGENKPGGKEDGAKGEAKNDGQKSTEGAKGETKDAGGKSEGAKGETKPGESKSGQGDKADPKGNSKTGDKGMEGAKPGSKGDQSGAKGKEGASKEGQAGEPKKGAEGNAKDSGGKGGDPKDGQPGSAKGDDKKGGTGEQKQGNPDSSAKKGNPDGKQAGAKGDPKGDPKAGGDSKSGGDPKAGQAQAKQGEAKPGESKSGQGQAKEGAPKDGGGDPKGGQGQAKDSPGGKGGDSPPGGKKDDNDVQASQKRIEEAGYPQTEAAKKIRDGDNKQASDDEKKALDKLNDAKKKLEKLLNQMREDEIERVLAQLEQRCRKMLQLQEAVLLDTESTERAIQKRPGKKADRAEKLAALKAADIEKEIIEECNKCITILESEGTAVAFPEVFQQLRQDMVHVKNRLDLTDTGDITQGIEKDIIASLKDMIEALQKAQQDAKDSKGKSKSGDPKSGKPGDQKLLELIQELKMVRALQKRLNDRTVDHARRFPGQEQAADPALVRELRILAERQQRIQQIVERIAKGDNK